MCRVLRIKSNGFFEDEMNVSIREVVVNRKKTLDS